MQTEVAEVGEPVAEGRGGSSTMPHKRNPVACAAILTAAQRTPGLMATLYASQLQQHERALGGWQAEWGDLPELITPGGRGVGAARRWCATCRFSRRKCAPISISPMG